MSRTRMGTRLLLGASLQRVTVGSSHPYLHKQEHNDNEGSSDLVSFFVSYLPKHVALDLTINEHTEDSLFNTWANWVKEDMVR